MCQLTGARPVRVHGIGARLSAETGVQNYGHLHVVFEDGSVGWYEAGWGPMMSEVAYFVKDVWGPKGSISIVVKQDGSDRGQRRQGQRQRRHRPAHQDQRAQAPPRRPRRRRQLRAGPTSGSTCPTSPTTRHLCEREQAWFLRTIREDIDLTRSMADAVTSLRIVLAAQQSIDEGGWWISSTR